MSFDIIAHAWYAYWYFVQPSNRIYVYLCICAQRKFACAYPCSRRYKTSTWLALLEADICTYWTVIFYICFPSYSLFLAFLFFLIFLNALFWLSPCVINIKINFYRFAYLFIICYFIYLLVYSWHKREGNHHNLLKVIKFLQNSNLFLFLTHVFYIIFHCCLTLWYLTIEDNVILAF